jgi:nucleoside triphosphate diphosphatase
MPMRELLSIMARLRDAANGCPWDLAQTFRTIAPFTLEEAYEVVDAIERDDPHALKDELGDLLFQVVFHARIAEEAGSFAFDDVVRSLADKLTRRHPHVFGDGPGATDAAGTAEQWERAKGAERAGRGLTSVMDDVPLALPALTRAAKLGRRAARVGFDWPDHHGARAKIDEELAEVDEAIGRGVADDIESEIGDLLFACTNLARHFNVDPERALRAASGRFERRFRYVEARQQAAGAAASLEVLEGWWREAKAQERDES